MAKKTRSKVGNKKNKSFIRRHKLIVFALGLLLIFLIVLNISHRLISANQKKKLELRANEHASIINDIKSILGEPSTAENSKFCEKTQPGYAIKQIDCLVVSRLLYSVEPDISIEKAQSIKNSISKYSKTIVEKPTSSDVGLADGYINRLYSDKEPSIPLRCIAYTSYTTKTKELEIHLNCTFKDVARAFYPIKDNSK